MAGLIFCDIRCRKNVIAQVFYAIKSYDLIIKIIIEIIISCKKSIVCRMKV